MVQTHRTPTRAAQRRIPSFHVMPGRTRCDGWTPVKQAEFIGELAETRSVTEAARRVGMRRETAYRLRHRLWSESFCAAWDAAMGRPMMACRPKFEGAGMMVARLDRLGLRGHALGMARPEPADAAETEPRRKVTNAELEWRYQTGIWSVILRRGKYAGVVRKADNSALLRLIARLDSAERRIDRGTGAGGKSRV